MVGGSLGQSLIYAIQHNASSRKQGGDSSPQSHCGSYTYVYAHVIFRSMYIMSLKQYALIPARSSGKTFSINLEKD